MRSKKRSQEKLNRTDPVTLCFLFVASQYIRRAVVGPCYPNFLQNFFATSEQKASHLFGNSSMSPRWYYAVRGQHNMLDPNVTRRAQGECNTSLNHRQHRSCTLSIVSPHQEFINHAKPRCILHHKPILVLGGIIKAICSLSTHLTNGFLRHYSFHKLKANLWTWDNV